MKRYSIENPRQSEYIKNKIKETNMKRYGVEHVFQSEIVKDKIKQTFLERYGVEHNMQLNETKEKIYKTNKDRYGNKIASKTDIVKNKIRNSHLNKSWKNILEYKEVIPLFSEDEFNGVGKYEEYKWKCIKCGNIFKDHTHSSLPRCLKCYPKMQGTSKKEQELQEFISNYINIENNKRFYYDKRRFYELDIFIPELNIGIEFNGLYWHSELEGSNKNYHIDKHNYFLSIGIKMFTVLENEWDFKNNIVKSILLNKINLTKNKIYGRKCVFRELDNNTYKTFLLFNHIQGYASSKYKYGLYYNEELVAIMGIGKNRFTNGYELTRFCNKLNTNIIGGFSKLLTNILKLHNIDNLISYCDLRYSDGKSYLKNGFELKYISKPNYWYFKPNSELQSRLKFQKHKLKDKLDIFNKDLTEWENMQMNGYNRIWDCGNFVLIKK